MAGRIGLTRAGGVLTIVAALVLGAAAGPSDAQVRRGPTPAPATPRAPIRTPSGPRTITTGTLMMTGLKTSTPAFAPKTIGTASLAMTGMKGSEPAFSPKTIGTASLAMTGLKGTVAPFTAKTISTATLTMTGFK